MVWMGTSSLAKAWSSTCPLHDMVAGEGKCQTQRSSASEAMLLYYCNIWFNREQLPSRWGRACACVPVKPVSSAVLLLSLPPESCSTLTLSGRAAALSAGDLARDFSRGRKERLLEWLEIGTSLHLLPVPAHC